MLDRNKRLGPLSEDDESRETFPFRNPRISSASRNESPSFSPAIFTSIPIIFEIARLDLPKFRPRPPATRAEIRMTLGLLLATAACNNYLGRGRTTGRGDRGGGGWISHVNSCRDKFRVFSARAGEARARARALARREEAKGRARARARAEQPPRRGSHGGGLHGGCIALRRYQRGERWESAAGVERCARSVAYVRGARHSPSLSLSPLSFYLNSLFPFLTPLSPFRPSFAPPLFYRCPNRDLCALPYEGSLLPRRRAAPHDHPASAHLCPRPIRGRPIMPLVVAARVT